MSFSRLVWAFTILCSAIAGAEQAAGVDGHWQGAIEVPAAPLEIDVDFSTGPDGTLTGDISIPAQGLRDLGLTDLALDGETIRFRIPGIPGDPSFDGTVIDDERIEGTFRQGGGELEFALVRGDAPAAAARAALSGFSELARQAVADFNVPGLAIAIVAGGEVVLAEGLGQRNLEDELPMTPGTLFAIGSTTKAMTTTVLGMLADDGRLDWDAPVRAYLPSFRLSDPMVSERITVRDLVTHRSGLPRHDLLWYNNNQPTRAEAIARLAHLELTADLRARYQYNNLMYMTAGYLAGQLAGATWEAVVRERLFEPLGMARTNFSVADSQRDPDHALPYRETDDEELERIPFRPLELIGPAGSVNSSVNEMSRWLAFNLRGGVAGERRLINAATLADVHAPQMTMGATSDRPDVSAGVYAMGWVVDTYRGHRRLGHGGGIDGFTTSVVLFPDDDLGLVAFSNAGSVLPGLLNRHAADAVLGLDAEDWIGEALKERIAGKQMQEAAEQKKETTRVAGTAPSHPLADYAGQYHHPGYGTLLIARAGETLSVEFNGIAAPLAHWHYDVWSGAETDGDPTFQDRKFQFRTDVDGLIAAVEARLEPTAGPIVFEKSPDPRLFDPAYLARLTGVYALETGTSLTVELSGNVLNLSVPGQPTYTLEPELSGRFVVQQFRLISVAFETAAEGPATKVLIHQPQGVFEAARKPE